MKFSVLLPSLLLLSCIGFSQNYNFVDATNVRASVNNKGLFFSSNDPGNITFNCPRGSGINLAFAASLWLSALDENDSLRVAATRYNDRGQDFFNGPVSNNYDSVFDDRYFSVYKVRKAVVDYHIQNYNLPNYIMDASIEKWPGNGRTQFGESDVLAPFVDVNNNGLYEPLLGDYPKIRGNTAVFVLMNDDRYPHTQSFGKPLGVELKLMFYGFSNINPILNNTIYLHAEITNKRQHQLKDFKVSNFIDFELGNFSNDRVGCDSAAALFFAYNSSIDPDIGSVKGFGTTPVSMGVLSLCENFNGFSSLTTSQQPFQTDPDTAYEYRRYQDGLWRDGNPMTIGGRGYGGSTPTKFLFSGSVTDTAQWSENTANMQSGDRRGVGTFNLGNLLPGETKVLDLAYLATIDSQAITNFNSVVNLMKQEAKTVKQYFSNSFSCNEVISSIMDKSSLELQGLEVYPNPAVDKVIINLKGDVIQSYTLYSVDGKIISNKTVLNNSAQLDIAEVQTGMYLLTVKSTNGKVGVRKILIQH